MKLIAENIHIISKNVRNALVERDDKFILNIVKNMNNVDCIDLNIGPANAGLNGILPWLTNIVQSNSSLSISFDTTNAKEMRNALEVCNNKFDSFVNSASDDIERLEKMTDIAAEFNTNLIALTLNSKIGIPKTADGRVELAFDIYETCMIKCISNERIYFDPLILPVSVDQSQFIESLNTIKILKESFEPQCNTVIGLSNISNGSPKELRPLINKVCLALAYGAGLDAVILDAFDIDLINMIKMFDSGIAKTESDKLLMDLVSVTSDFVDINDIKFNQNDKNLLNIYKAAQILLNKNIYSHSFTQV